MLITAPALLDLAVLLAAYDALPDVDRAAYLASLPEPEVEHLARALARRHMQRPARPPVASSDGPSCAALGLPSLSIDEDGAVRVLAAVCELARADACKNVPGAGEWLAELQACRPRSVRLLAREDPPALSGHWGRARHAAVAAD